MMVLKQSVECLGATEKALELIEIAGRTCYKSENQITSTSKERFVRNIIKSGHESVLEHASATFRIVTDRGVSHEIVRHRIASYSQESTRYIKYGKNMQFILPVTLEDGTWFSTFGVKNKVKVTAKEYLLLSKPLQHWLDGCLNAKVSYLELLEDGCKPETARSVLSNCVKTEIVMTANFREWRWFLKLRNHRTAHPQIQEVAKMIKGWFEENYPVIIHDL